MLQSEALTILQSGANVFITGSAGSGKTYLLNQFIDYLRRHRISAAVTASTGIAATHLGGQTIHSFTSLGVRESLSEYELEQLKHRPQVHKRLQAVKVLIVDEVSMLAGNTLANVDVILRYVRARDEAFGGVQLVLCGDFFQLPPVNKNRQNIREIIAFMHPVWLAAKLQICYLTEQHRQQESPLLRLLDEMRRGEVSEYSYELLQAKLAERADAEQPASIKLYTHNVDVDGYNQRQLQAIDKPARSFTATTTGTATRVEQLRKSVLAPDVLEVKIGAQVMFVKNNYEKGYFNGSLGRVTAFTRDGGWPVVECHSGQIIVAESVDWVTENENGKQVASFSQVPLRLAWAITVHKSQGMTLECAEIDLSKCFEIGQGYVALSRLQDFAGLTLSGLNSQALEMSSLVRRADERFQALSEQCWQQWQELSFEQQEQKLAATRLRLGAVDPDDIDDSDDWQSSAKADTYELTRDLVLQGLSLDELAEERGYTKGTMIRHLAKIAERDPELDLSPYRPPEEIIEQIAAALEHYRQNPDADKLDRHGRLKSSAIHDHFDAQISYEDIHLALLFIRPNSS